MININLVAERRARKIREITILRLSTLSVICAATLMVLLNLLAFFLHTYAQRELQNVDAQLKAIQPEYTRLLAIRAEIADKRPVEKLLEQVQMSEAAWMTILADLSTITPDGIVIEHITTKNEKKAAYLSIVGVGTDKATVGNFMLEFSQKTQWAEKPNLKSIRTVKVSGQDEGAPDVERFDLEVPIRGMVGGVL